MHQADIDDFTTRLLNLLSLTMENSRLTLSGMARADFFHPDEADRAALETDRNIALLMGERDRRLIEDIHAALSRIEDGDYGVCLECGEDISLARLRAQPTARLCMTCMEEVERGRFPYHVLPSRSPMHA